MEDQKYGWNLGSLAVFTIVFGVFCKIKYDNQESIR